MDTHLSYDNIQLISDKRKITASLIVNKHRFVLSNSLSNWARNAGWFRKVIQRRLLVVGKYGRGEDIVFIVHCTMLGSLHI